MQKLMFVFILFFSFLSCLSAQAISDNVVIPGLRQQFEDALKEMDRNDDAISKNKLEELKKSFPDNSPITPDRPTIQFVPSFCLQPSPPPQCLDVCEGGNCGILQ